MVRATRTRWILAVAGGALLAGCGRGTDPGQSAPDRAARGNAAASADAAALANAEADLVSAVSAAGSVAPVGLRFRVPEPPRVGQPLRLELVLTQQAGLDIDHLLVALQPGDGLAVESERSFEFQSPPAGATQRMAVTVRPQQPGLLSIGATVLVDSTNTSLTRSFSIPLIAAP